MGIGAWYQGLNPDIQDHGRYWPDKKPQPTYPLPLLETQTRTPYSDRYALGAPIRLSLPFNWYAAKVLLLVVTAKMGQECV